MNTEARAKFERRIDEAAKKTVQAFLREGDPLDLRHRLRSLLRKVAVEAAKSPDMFDLDKEE